MKVDSGEQVRSRHRYTFVIVNKPVEIERIEGRIFAELAMIDEYRRICDHPIKNSEGLHARAFSFSTDVPEILNMDRIYANPGQFRRDRDLYERDEPDMIKYIERLFA